MQAVAANTVAIEQQQQPQQQFYYPTKNPPTDVKNMGEKLVQVLETGKESATQMKSILDHDHQVDGHDDDGCFLKGQLDVVLTSFAASISMVNNFGFFDRQTLKRPNPTPNHHHHHIKSQDQFGDWEAPKTPKDGRGCHRRRKTELSREVERSNIDDGHSWRKYGQKAIQNTEHPRSYYRCTHKTEQGCQATRQIQQISETPPIYKIIYHGHHTCKNPLKTHPFLVDLVDDHDNSSILLSFETSNNPKHGPNHFMMFPSSSTTLTSSSSSSTSIPSASSPIGNAMVEQEYKPIKEDSPSELSNRHHEAHIQHPSSSDFLPITFDLTTATTVSDDVISLAEVYSSAVSPHGVEEDLISYMMAEQSFDFMGDVFQDHLLFA